MNSGGTNLIALCTSHFAVTPQVFELGQTVVTYLKNSEGNPCDPLRIQPRSFGLETFQRKQTGRICRRWLTRHSRGKWLCFRWCQSQVSGTTYIYLHAHIHTNTLSLLHLLSQLEDVTNRRGPIEIPFENNQCTEQMWKNQCTEHAMWTCCTQAGKSRWVEIFRGKGKGTGAVVLGP